MTKRPLQYLSLFLRSFSMMSFAWLFSFHSPKITSADDGDTVYNGPGLKGGIDLLKEYLYGSGIETEATLVQAIIFWTKILIIISGVVSFVAFVYAGFLFIISFANEQNQEKAKKTMLYAGIGIIVVLLSFVLTNFFIKAAV